MGGTAESVDAILDTAKAAVGLATERPHSLRGATMCGRLELGGRWPSEAEKTLGTLTDLVARRFDEQECHILRIGNRLGGVSWKDFGRVKRA